MARRSTQVLAALMLALALSACRGSQAPPEDPPRDAVKEASQAPVTFSKDVAPILYANCVTCHRPGQVAPFPLITYEDVRLRADAIAQVTGTGEMPPWLPEAGGHAFVGERRLRADQIALIRRWADTGAAEGDRANLPPVPAWPDGWQLGQPDLVATMRRPYMLQPGPRDRYRQIVFPLSIPAGRFVRAVEFRPGSSHVHHAVIRVDRTYASRRKDGADGMAGFEGIMASDVRNPDGHFIGWAPGRGPIVSPPGMPWRLDRGADLVVELHMIPGDRPLAVQPTIGLYFTDQPPTGTPVELTMGVMTLDIPAGDPAYRLSQEFVLPVDVTLLSVYPHAHYLGKEMQVVATRPDGTVNRLLHIRKWDFHWQQEYRFVTPVELPRGTTLAMHYVFDNSAENEDNPSSPPRRVMYGLQSTDEMANLALQVLPRSRTDGRLLAKAFLDRHMQETVAAAEMRARLEPGNPERQWELGRSYVEVGRTAEAIPPLEASLRANPTFPRAHDYLGRALYAQRRLEEALGHLRRAAALDPQDEVLHLDLGKVLADTGQTADAMRSFERALKVNPDYGQAHEGMGVALVRLGRFTDAIAAFQRALALTPESPSVENGLAVALAQSGRKQEALEHVRRALDLDPTYLPARDNLARLQRGR